MASTRKRDPLKDRKDRRVLKNWGLYGPMTNWDRAQRAESALDGVSTYDSEDLDDNASDLLADLMHLCRLKEIDFELLTRRAEVNFNAEVDEEGA